MFHKRSVRAMLAEELLNILAKLRTPNTNYNLETH